MPAKIVMIFEDQDFSFRPGDFPEYICRREFTDAAADNNQIVVFRIRGRLGPLLAIAKLMGDFEGAAVAASHPTQSRRIIIGGSFRSKGRLPQCDSFAPVQLVGKEGTSYR